MPKYNDIVFILVNKYFKKGDYVLWLLNEEYQLRASGSTIKGALLHFMRSRVFMKILEIEKDKVIVQGVDDKIAIDKRLVFKVVKKIEYIKNEKTSKLRPRRRRRRSI